MKSQIKMLKTLHQTFSCLVEHCSLYSVMFCVYAYLLVFLSPGISGAPVNVAMNKLITANITCGMFGRELYYPHTQIPWQASQRIDFECSNTSVHPPGAMVDGDSDTWWQSTSRFRMIQSGFGWQGNPEVVIELDLTQAFEVEHITLQMGDSKRPGRLELEKSLDGTSYRPWVYMVSEEGDCSNIYNTFLMNQPRSLLSVVCVAYQTDPMPKYENITFDFTGVPNFLAAWRNLQYLRIKFYGLDLTLGVLGDMFHHYTVQKLEVFAECMCNGHHTDCEHSNTTGQFECVCGENTEGRFCERCQPFYNQQPFRYQDPCEACECFGHSDSCYYNATIANFTMSLDANGKRSGGGVCIDCQDDTAGVNCEKCRPYYYRPDGKTQKDKAVCTKCKCEGPGVTVNPETGLVGDCIMNNDRPLLPGQKPGDCFCKANVTGPQCDACKPGFFNLSMENPDGCQECACDTRGTVGASAKCTSDAAGTCTCKKFTRGRTCGDCTEGYYGMETSNAEGCKKCVCNKGGAYNSICNQDTGQCPCRPYVGGLKCDGPEEGAYYPDLHHLSGEFEDLRTNIYQEIPGYLGLGYAKATESVPAEMFFSVDKYPALEGKYYLYVRYSNPQVTTALVRIYGDGFYENLAMVLRTCVNKWCYAQVGRRMTFDLTVSPVYQVTVRSTSPCYMDRIIALPVEFVDPTKFFGRNKARKFTKTCNVIMNNMNVTAIPGEGKPKEDYCLNGVFELTAFYFNGSLPCNCNSYGSVNATSQCEKYKGQCLCREGVGGRACDQCNAGYFNLTLDGCTKCDCAGEHKVCNRTTGQCECPPFTTGRRCDVCEPEYWKWSSTDGCQACNCSDIGSVSLNCNQTTGICDCKPGVGGDKCDQCKEGFRQFSDTGCLPCNCDPDGSLSPVCDQTTAQCPCKTHTAGQLCDQCKAGSFYMSESHRSGCLECICMGITDKCGSTGLRKQMMDAALINSTTNATAFFLTSSTLGGNIPVTLTSVEGSDMVQGQMTGAADLYFTAFQGLVGNLAGLYENVISFDVFWLEGQPLGTQQDAHLWIYGRKDTKFSFKVPPVPSNQTTRVNVTIIEDNAVKKSGNVTRGELLLALTEVQQVLYPAVWYSLPHTSSIGNIQYEYPGATGTGEQALSVEQCQCGPGYEGLSCEKCAFGYHRENKTIHDYLGTCKKCECYGHATLCDPETGKCINCQHNTKDHINSEHSITELQQAICD